MQRRDYAGLLDLRQTQRAIKLAKDTFEEELAAALRLERVTAPLFVLPETGLNDNLSGNERPVGFDIKETGKTAQIVQSLAKWKRHALGKYGFAPGEGLYTDMNAIRRDETADETHSLYVDQWDWERVITREQRTVENLKQVMRGIHAGLYATSQRLAEAYPALRDEAFPRELAFITAQELLERYPDMTSAQREYAFVREAGAGFVIGIGHELSNGAPHDKRAPDYDDWNLNGDWLIYYRPLDIAMELQSMGIRVDAASLERQLELSGMGERRSLPYHQDVLNGRLPLTMGGGIGQSRLCMLLLKKTHIGQVQVGVWPERELRKGVEDGAELL